MVRSQIHTVIQHLREAEFLQEGGQRPDGQLLERFVHRRDEAGIAILVQRHGPMVWGVCRRILRHHHDAEDAFQATFLVLARKAASIRPREMVANWLHGVAHQTALKARATRSKRQRRERQVTNMPEPEMVEHQDLRPDLQLLLDEELRGLPAKYRIAILLCDLEGKSRHAAAQQLGLPEGTVASRLARARTLLAKRLAAKGVVLSGGGLAAALSADAVSACVPPLVLSSTIKAVTRVAAGHAVAGLVSAQVTALTEGVVKAMLLSKLRIVTAILCVIALLGAGAALQTRDGQTQAGEPDAAQQAAALTGQKVPETPKPQSDKEAIQGRWKLVALEFNGWPEEPTEDMFVGVKFADDKISFKVKHGDIQEFSFTLDKTHKPKHLDLRDPSGKNKEVLPCIYHLDGDILVLCMTYDYSKIRKRPKEFKTEPGDKLWLMVFQREKLFVLPQGGGKVSDVGAGESKHLQAEEQPGQDAPKQDLAALEGVWEKVPASRDGSGRSGRLQLSILGDRAELRMLSEDRRSESAVVLSLLVGEVKGIRVVSLGLLGKREIIAYSVEADELVLVTGGRTLFGKEGVSLRGEWVRVKSKEK